MNIRRAPLPLTRSEREQCFIDDMMRTKVFKRLGNVSFLGAVDYFNSHKSKTNTAQFSRADHTRGVLNLSLKLLNLIDVSSEDRMYVIASALCHDLGHSPFSHSVEKVYKKINPLINHRVVLEFLLSEDRYGVCYILREYGLSSKKIISISVTDLDDFSWVFHSPINVDTLDGIGRFLFSFKFPLPFDVDGAIESLALLRNDSVTLNEEQVENLDVFWRLKSAFYDQFLTSGRFARYEEAFVDRIYSSKKNVELSDYLKDDLQFEEEMGLFPELIIADRTLGQFGEAREVSAFKINKFVKLRSLDDLYKRYRREGRSESSGFRQ